MIDATAIAAQTDYAGYEADRSVSERLRDWRGWQLFFYYALCGPAVYLISFLVVFAVNIFLMPTVYTDMPLVTLEDLDLVGESN